MFARLQKSSDEGTQLLIGRRKRINDSLQFEEYENILINIVNNVSFKFLNYQIIVSLSIAIIYLNTAEFDFRVNYPTCE